MAITDDIKGVFDNIDNLSKNGVPVTVKHEFDLPSVSYTALVAFLVVVGAVILIGVKDVIVNRITS
ncbi:hypothetical protein GCM10027578_22250 [Spirosoma luteolum]